MERAVTMRADVAETIRDLRAQLAAREGELRDVKTNADAYVGDLHVQLHDARGQVAVLREALERRAHCEIYHAGEPTGTTCLDVERRAREHPGQFTDEYGAKLRAGKERCAGCGACIALTDTAALAAGLAAHEREAGRREAIQQLRELAVSRDPSQPEFSTIRSRVLEAAADALLHDAAVQSANLHKPTPPRQ